LKRVLIITYYWPPSGGSGVQRWLKFVKYLPEFDWQPVVYTPSNPDFALKDESLLKDIPEEAEIIKRPIWEPYSVYRNLLGKDKKQDTSAGVVKSESGGITNKLANWLRGNLFVPDPRVFWRKPSVKYLKNYLSKYPVDIIVSTGTPHSMHLIALDLKKHFPNIPWVADFRDPWSELDMLKSYHIHPFIFKKYKRLESEVLKQCDVCLTTSNVWAKDFERLGAKRTAVITNGYDEDDFNYKVEPYKDFVIAHFGLFNHLRNPIVLWEALNELCAENELLSSKLKIHLGGTIDPENLKAIKKFKFLKDKIVVFPYLSHEEVIKEYMKSSLLLLLLFNSDSGKGNIPGKLFEYIASTKPILAFGPDYGDSAEIVDSFNKSKYFNYNLKDISKLKKTILNMLKGNKPETMYNGKKYSRKTLTLSLSNFFEKLI